VLPIINPQIIERSIINNRAIIIFCSYIIIAVFYVQKPSASPISVVLSVVRKHSRKIYNLKLTFHHPPSKDIEE